MRYCVHSALNLNLSNTELTLFCVMIVSDVVPSRVDDTKERSPQKGAAGEHLDKAALNFSRFSSKSPPKMSYMKKKKSF